jgi:hypothetical protein
VPKITGRGRWRQAPNRAVGRRHRAQAGPLHDARRETPCARVTAASWRRPGSHCLRFDDRPC